MKCLFLIPARGGSKGIPHKNIKHLCGKPLIQYSTEMAQKFTSDENICVSTDDLEIKSVVETLGLEVPFLRPLELASDTATTSDVIAHALNFYKERGIEYDVVMLFQPTSPLCREEDVKACLDLYCDALDMVTTVKQSFVSAVLCHEDDSGYLQMFFGKNSVRRQDSEKLYEYNGAVYVINAESVLEKGMIGFKKIKKVVMPDIYSLDIDTMLDWCIVETIMANMLSTSNGYGNYMRNEKFMEGGCNSSRYMTIEVQFSRHRAWRAA